jgi:hypothetical protein
MKVFGHFVTDVLCGSGAEQRSGAQAEIDFAEFAGRHGCVLLEKSREIGGVFEIELKRNIGNA